MDELETALAETIAEVLEQQAFMFAEPQDCAELETEAESFMSASICFTGSVNGMLEGMLTTSLGVDLAANVLGIEPDDEQAEQLAQDALKEMLNVICGQLLTRVYGAAPIFQLSIPVSQLLDVIAWEELQMQENCVGLLIDDEHPALFRLSLEEGPLEPVVDA
jgi:CheY-specific phosphatase CheX